MMEAKTRRAVAGAARVTALAAIGLAAGGIDWRLGLGVVGLLAWLEMTRRHTAQEA